MPDIKHFNPDTVLGTVMHLFWKRDAASTGIQDIVAATGVSRSSLYATFGGKQELYLAALRRYVEERSHPAFTLLTTNERGIPAISDFFQELIQIRCSGQHARWGCMITNADAGPEGDDPDVRQLLDLHHEYLYTAMRSALETAHTHQQLSSRLGLDATADLLALLTYGINLRSRGGADKASLWASVSVALDSLCRHRPNTKETERHG